MNLIDSRTRPIQTVNSRSRFALNDGSTRNLSATDAMLMPIPLIMRSMLNKALGFVTATPARLGTGVGEDKSITAKVGGTDVDAALAGAVGREDPASVAELSEDMLKDYQVKETIGLLVSNIRDTKVAITLEGDDSDDAANSELADAVIKNIRESWEDFLDKCFPLMNLEQSILAMGRAAFEKVIGNDPQTQTTRMKLRFLPATVNSVPATKLRLTELGAFDGIDLEVGGKRIHIPAELSLWTAIGETDIEPHGRSIFLGAAAEVRSKRKELEDLLTGYVKRCAINGPVIHTPPRIENGNGEMVDAFDALSRQMRSAWKYGNPLIFSNATDEHGKFNIDVTQQAYELDPAPVTEITKMLDAQQSRALFVHEDLVSGNSEVGSYAKQKMIVRMMLAVVGGILKSVMTSFRKYYAEKEVALNWLANPPRVKMAVSGLSYSLIETLAESYLTANTLSPLAIVSDIQEILKSAGVPLVADFDAKLEEALANASGQGGTDPDDGGDPSNPDDPNFDPFADPNADDEENVDPLTGKTLAVEFDDDNPLRLLSNRKKKSSGVGVRSSGHQPPSKQSVVRNQQQPQQPQQSRRTDPNRPRGGKGTNQYAVKGVGKTKPAKSHKPNRVAQKSPSPRTKSEIAKASATRVDSEIQRYCEEGNEAVFAKMMGGKRLPDNEPVDVLVGGPPPHGIELKTVVMNKAAKITMKRSAMDLKAKWSRQNKAPVHTVVIDDSKVFNALGKGQHDISKRRILYRRGFGSFRIDGMHEVTGGTKELKALLTTSKAKLPTGAK